MEHFLSITLCWEVHDSTEREQRRDVKKVKKCEQIEAKMMLFPMEVRWKIFVESEYGRAWKCFSNEGWIYYEGIDWKVIFH